MSIKDIRALTFDTGGTILDWHTGFTTALAALGARHRVTRDWHALANEMRRRSLKKMVNLGEHEPPAYNFDGAHRQALDEVLGGKRAVIGKRGRAPRDLVGRGAQSAVLARLPGGAAEAARTLHMRVVHHPQLPDHHRHRAAQRPDLGRGHLLRGDRQVQGAPAGLPERGALPSARSRPVLHGRLPQFRPRRREGGRLQDRVRAPARRVGSRRATGPEAERAPRHRRRYVCPAARGLDRRLRRSCARHCAVRVKRSRTEPTADPSAPRRRSPSRAAGRSRSARRVDRRAPGRSSCW